MTDAELIRISELPPYGRIIDLERHNETLRRLVLVLAEKLLICSEKLGELSERPECRGH